MSNCFQQWTSTVNSLLPIFCSTSSPDYSCCGTGLVARWHGQTLSVCVLYHDCKYWFQLWSHLTHLRQNTFFFKIYNWKRPLDFSGSLTIRCSMMQNLVFTFHFKIHSETSRSLYYVYIPPQIILRFILMPVICNPFVHKQGITSILLRISYFRSAFITVN